MFNLNKHLHGSTLVIKIEGYCNQDAGDDLLKIIQGEFESGSSKHLVFNFSLCNGVNSPGVARVLEATEIVTEDFNGRVYLCGLDKIKTSFFEMVGILELAEAVSGEEEALKLIAVD